MTQTRQYQQYGTRDKFVIRFYASCHLNIDLMQVNSSQAPIGRRVVEFYYASSKAQFPNV